MSVKRLLHWLVAVAFFTDGRRSARPSRPSHDCVKLTEPGDFFSPAEPHFCAEIGPVTPAGPANHVGDRKVVGLQGEGDVFAGQPVGPELPVGPRVLARAPAVPATGMFGIV